MPSYSSNNNCYSTPYEGCSFTGTHLTPSSTATFHTCIFTSLSSTDSGGAISFTSGDSLSIEDCIFTSCYNIVTPSDFDGGGAIHVTAACTLTITSSLFIECNTPCYGGAVHAQRACKSLEVLYSTFFDCYAGYGGGMTTYCGPSSSVVSSRFILCKSLSTGGGIFHNSLQTYSHLTVSDDLFTNNRADYLTDQYLNRGGGGFEDYRGRAYTSRYSFSFFHMNSAPTGVGNDISIHENKLDANNIKHCFTTRATDSFWNNGTYTKSNTENWLPLTTSNIDESEPTHTHNAFLSHSTTYHVNHIDSLVSSCIQ